MPHATRADDGSAHLARRRWNDVMLHGWNEQAFQERWLFHVSVQGALYPAFENGALVKDLIKECGFLGAKLARQVENGRAVWIASQIGRPTTGAMRAQVNGR